MKNIDLENISEIKNEIKFLLNDIEKKEILLIEDLKKNKESINFYKNCLEEIIEEYHLLCKKIYK